jgi:H+/Cl- antiporter ClcA
MADSIFNTPEMLENLTDDAYDYDVLNMLNEEQSGFNYMAMFYLIMTPVCCVIGLTGNCLVFILIKTNQIFRRLPSSPYLMALAGCSSTFLFSLLSFWTEEVSLGNLCYRLK